MASVTQIPKAIRDIVAEHPELEDYLEQQEAEIKHLKSRKKYGLVWEEEETKEDITNDARLPVLKEITSKRILTTDKQDNVLIEGDNLHALSVLNYTHKGKIDVIYIDPPYNTGKKNEWIYNDKYIDAEDSYKHSKWLSSMSKRLILAKKLLSDKGIIFISIDDNEQAQLKLLCDEIFNEKNFIANIIWQHSIQPKGYTNKFSVHHNYILCYTKTDLFQIQLLERTQEHNKNYSNPDNDPNGLWRTGDVRNSLYRKNLIYDIITPSGKIIKPPIKGWRWSHDTIQKKIQTGEIFFSKDESRIIRKIYLNMVKGRTPETIWFGNDVGTTRTASREIKDIFNDKKFDTPKPIGLIKRISEISSNSNSVILDFFAGSGTTGHAVLELNKEDGGNRQFILCTNNENNICTEVCYPRIKKVIKGYKNSKDKKIDGLGGGLTYYKIDQMEKEPNSELSVPPLITDANKKRMITKVAELLCMKEWCFDLVYQNKSSIPKFSIYKNNNGDYMGMIYDSDSVLQFIKKIDNMTEIKKINTYVFSDIMSSAIRRNKKIKFESIPTEILGVWNRIFESNIHRRRLIK